MAEPPHRCNPSGPAFSLEHALRQMFVPAVGMAPLEGARIDVHGGSESSGTGWTWFIYIVVFGLVAWGVAELIGVGAGRADVVRSTTAGLGGVVRDDPIVELHRLLPDATDDLGRPVSVDGAVVGEASRAGFWLRDLRDNIVFVDVEGAGYASVEAGDEVRVVGRVALFSPGEQADRLERAGLVVPATARVIRDVKVQPLPGGIEILRNE